VTASASDSESLLKVHALQMLV